MFHLPYSWSFAMLMKVIQNKIELNGNSRKHLVFECNPKYYTWSRLDKETNIDYFKYAQMYTNL